MLLLLTIAGYHTIRTGLVSSCMYGVTCLLATGQCPLNVIVLTQQCVMERTDESAHR